MDKIKNEQPIVKEIARSIRHIIPTFAYEVGYDEFGTQVRNDVKSITGVEQSYTGPLIDEPHWRIVPEAKNTVELAAIRNGFVKANIQSETQGLPVKAVFATSGSTGRAFIGITTNPDMASEKGSVSTENLKKYADIVESVFQKEKVVDQSTFRS
jgi:hypothetical protein